MHGEPVGGCDCITIFNKCEHFHILLKKRKKKHASHLISRFFKFCLAFFPTRRLISPMHTLTHTFAQNCCCVTLALFVVHLAVPSLVELSELCRFHHFYSVRLCFLNTWWVKHFITLHSFVGGVSQFIYDCNPLLMNSNTAFAYSCELGRFLSHFMTGIIPRLGGVWRRTIATMSMLKLNQQLIPSESIKQRHPNSHTKTKENYASCIFAHFYVQYAMECNVICRQWSFYGFSFAFKDGFTIKWQIQIEVFVIAPEHTHTHTH